jgi:hypothetical protein
LVQSLSAKNKSIYVHSHYQHFKKTVDDIKFKEDSQRIILGTFAAVKKSIQLKKGEILELETNFLKILYPNLTVESGRKSFKKDILTAIGKDPLVKDYLDTRQATFSKDDLIAKSLDKTSKQLNKYKITDADKKKYIMDKFAMYKKVFLNIASYLEDFFNIIENLPKQNPSKHTKMMMGLKNRAKAIAGNASQQELGTISDSVKSLLEVIKKIEQGEFVTFADVGKDLASKLFTAINESMYELVVIAATAQVVYAGREESERQISKMLESSDVI